MPIILKSKRELLEEPDLIEAMLNFIDIVALRWRTDHLEKVRTSDPEEYQYQERLMREYVRLSLLVL